MVKTIKENIIKSRYFIFSIIALILFMGVVWFAWRDIERESLKRTKAMVKDVAVSNIVVVSNIINDYTHKLSFIRDIAISSDRELIEKTIQFIKKKDSSITSIAIIPQEEFLQEKKLFVTNRENKLLRFNLPLGEDKEIILEVQLEALHNKIAESKDLQHAYITIVAENKYVFHPDENLLGKVVKKQEKHFGTEVRKVFSDFLNMDVYTYTEFHEEYNGEKWLFTANVLNIDFQEFIKKRGDAFIGILLSALVAFILIVALGLLRWRKEFEMRKGVEQQNLELALKNEQQKQAAVSTELEILKSGLNPHFLFNALSSLKILVSRNPNLAKDFAVHLSNVYRYMLKYEKKDTVTLQEELKFVEDYMELQKIRFGDKIKLVLQLNSITLQKMVPPVSVQLLVENAIKHTIIAEGNPLHIIVTSHFDELIVTNDYRPRLSKGNNIGKGIENLEKRYSLLTDRRCNFSIQKDKYIAQIPLLSKNSHY